MREEKKKLYPVHTNPSDLPFAFCTALPQIEKKKEKEGRKVRKRERKSRSTSIAASNFLCLAKARPSARGEERGPMQKREKEEEKERGKQLQDLTPRVYSPFFCMKGGDFTPGRKKEKGKRREVIEKEKRKKEKGKGALPSHF